MIGGQPRLVVSVHDVAPATERASRQWVDDLDRRGLRATLLVVPGPWRGGSLERAPGIACWLRERATLGHEIALHGWDHTAAAGGSRGRAAIGRLVARGCGEFWSLTEHEAAERVRRGLDVMATAGLQPSGFTPPGWLASRAAVRGLRRAGLRYVTSHTAVVDLVTGLKVHAVALCQRPSSRVEGAAATLVSRAPGHLAGLGGVVRIALHPDDLNRPRLRRTSLAGIDASLAAGARPLTYAELLAESSLGRLPAPDPGSDVFPWTRTDAG